MSRRVAVTRPPGPSDRFARLLSRAGLQPVFLPVLRRDPIADSELAALAARFADAGGADLAVATSPAGAEGLGRLFARCGLVKPPAAAIGSATAAALREAGFEVDQLAPGGDASSLGRALEESDLLGRRVVVALGSRNDPGLVQRLEAAGARVFPALLYRTGPRSEREVRFAARALLEGEVDLVSLLSGSAVWAFVERLGRSEARRALAARPRAALGATAAAALGRIGLSPNVRPARPVLEDLVESIERWFDTAARR